MAISDKLTYLNDTKTQLKDMINYGLDTGEKITSETTFRNYVKSLFDAFIKTMTYPDVLYNNLPKVTGEGTSLSLNDTVYAPMRVELSPSALEQETTTGKNLGYLEIGSINNAGQIIEVGNKVYRTLIVDNLPAGTYTFSVDLSNCFLIREFKDNTASTLSVSSQTRTVTTTTDGKYMIAFRKQDSSEITEELEAQLEAGDTATSYEPFTYGASPNPQYPQEIHTVSGENEVKVEGKNLFSTEMELGVYAYATGEKATNNQYIRTKDLINVVAGESYVMSFTGASPRAGSGFLFYKDGTFISTVQKTSLTFDVPENANQVAYNLYIGSGASPSAISNIQIEKGTTTTTYEPHQEQSLPLSLGDLEYCKIGDYEDEFYKATESDTGLTAGKWYLKKNIKKLVLNGTENWGITGSGTDNWFYRFAYTSNVASGGVGLSNYYQWVGITSTNTTKGIYVVGGYVRIRYGTEDTVENFKTWLSTNNVTLYYQLSTPTYTLLSDTLQTQLEAIWRANSYKDQTNISQTNADLPFVIKLSAIEDLSGIFELIQG